MEQLDAFDRELHGSSSISPLELVRPPPHELGADVSRSVRACVADGSRAAQINITTVYRKEWLPAITGREPEPLPAPTTRSAPPKAEATATTTNTEEEEAAASQG
jgi:hypothetical protein